MKNQTDTIYVITKGRYSDYRVIGATKNKTLAKQLCEMHSTNYDTANIEEFKDGITQDWYAPKQYWLVNLEANNRIGTASRHWCENDYDYPFVDRYCCFGEDGKIYVKRVVDGIVAEDEDKAKKIASDTIAQYEAMENMM